MPRSQTGLNFCSAAALYQPTGVLFCEVVVEPVAGMRDGTRLTIPGTCELVEETYIAGFFDGETHQRQFYQIAFTSVASSPSPQGTSQTLQCRLLKPLAELPKA